MKIRYSCLLLWMVSFLPFAQIAISQNTNYSTNKEPLIETPYTPLPLGSVKANGWLLKQLQLAKRGINRIFRNPVQ